MRKRNIAFILIFVLICSLAGCGEAEKTKKKGMKRDSSKTPTPTVMADPTPTDTPTVDPTPTNTPTVAPTNTPTPIQYPSGVTISSNYDEEMRALELYGNYYQGVANEEFSLVTNASLIWLDDDKIPELCITSGFSHVDLVSVYTIVNDRVQFLGEFGEFGSFSYREKAGEVVSVYGAFGSEFTEWITFENGVRKNIKSFEKNVYDEEHASYAYGEASGENADSSDYVTEVTKEQYEAAYAELQAVQFTELTPEDFKECRYYDFYTAIYERWTEMIGCNPFEKAIPAVYLKEMQGGWETSLGGSTDGSPWDSDHRVYINDDGSAVIVYPSEKKEVYVLKLEFYPGVSGLIPGNYSLRYDDEEFKTKSYFTLYDNGNKLYFWRELYEEEISYHVAPCETFIR